MIEILKKYPKTFKEFEKYMEIFDDITFFSADDIECFDGHGCHNHKIPPQFLVGCYLEFLAKNQINLSVYGQIKQTMLIWNRGDNIQVFTNLEEAIDKAFSILEEKE